MKLALLSIACLTLFTALHAQESSEPAQRRILIAMEQTKFKKQLVEQMKSLLSLKPVTITIVEDSKKELSQHKAADFDLIFITNSGVMSHVRPWVAEWIDNNKADSSKILLHTTKARKWTEEVYVDAVSSASDKKQVPQLAEEYLTKLLNK